MKVSRTRHYPLILMAGGRNRMINFFAKQGGSGEVRGRQVARFLGARVNPRSGYENEPCVYIKTQPRDEYPKNTYLDIIDERQRIPWLKEHPDVKVIASSLTAYEYLTRELKNKVIFIPQHHCNYERKVKKEFKGRVGVIGGVGAIQHGLKDAFKEFTWINNYRTRKDVVDGYDKIDIQVIFRPHNKVLKNPLKIINAASFGIPTIAYPELAYKEVDGFYTKAYSINEIVEKSKNLTYNKERLIEMAEPYHIENIAKLYNRLIV